MFPLLALGILAGNEMMRLRRNDQREAEQKAAIGGLLGARPQEMGPPEESGAMGWSGGRGLLADPADPVRQMEFAGGIMGLPGLANVGAQLLGGSMDRQQRTAAEEAAAKRWREEFNEGGRRFGLTFGLDQERFGEQKRMNQVSAEQWLQQFEQNKLNANRQYQLGLGNLDVSRGQLDLGRQRLGYDMEKDKRDAQGPMKLGTGWGWVNSASGMVPAPLYGEDRAKPILGDDNLTLSLGHIDRMRNLIGGVEETTPQGKKKRMGGQGTELWGQTAATYSQLRADLIGSMGKLREAGVLDKNEYERFEKLFPDPTSFTNNAKSLIGMNDTMIKAYDEARDIFVAKQQAHRRAYPWLVPPPPPGAQVQ